MEGPEKIPGVKGNHDGRRAPVPRFGEWEEKPLQGTYSGQFELAMATRLGAEAKSTKEDLRKPRPPPSSTASQGGSGQDSLTKSDAKTAYRAQRKSTSSTTNPLKNGSAEAWEVKKPPFVSPAACAPSDLPPKGGTSGSKGSSPGRTMDRRQGGEERRRQRVREYSAEESAGGEHSKGENLNETSHKRDGGEREKREKPALIHPPLTLQVESLKNSPRSESGESIRSPGSRTPKFGGWQEAQGLVASGESFTQQFEVMKEEKRNSPLRVEAGSETNRKAGYSMPERKVKEKEGEGALASWKMEEKTATRRSSEGSDVHVRRGGLVVGPTLGGLSETLGGRWSQGSVGHGDKRDAVTRRLLDTSERGRREGESNSSGKVLRTPKFGSWDGASGEGQYTKEFGYIKAERMAGKEGGGGGGGKGGLSLTKVVPHDDKNSASSPINSKPPHTGPLFCCLAALTME